MTRFVALFDDIPTDHLPACGGKGASIASMKQAGFPVPNGFVIFPDAYDGTIVPDARFAIIDRLTTLRVPNPVVSFAVRSSALAEDSASASFAGQFESVIGVQSNDEVIAAVRHVFESGRTDRVQAYSTSKGLSGEHRIAVVVQIMVPSDLAGVLFTADPLTGSEVRMPGNVVHGQGEALVSGEANAEEFTLYRPKGNYEGPPLLASHARTLYRTGTALETLFGAPQDIEWAVSGDRFYVLQSRPITTLTTEHLDTYEMNDTLRGDFIWTNTNIGEAMPGVFTPLSWSILRKLDKEQERMAGHFLFSGNIAGRLYTNASLLLSLGPVIGKQPRDLVTFFSDVFAGLPEGMDIPAYPIDRREFARDYPIRVLKRIGKVGAAAMKLRGYVERNPKQLDRLRAIIRRSRSGPDLAAVWPDLWKHNVDALYAMYAGSSRLVTVYRLQNQLFNMVDEEVATALLSRQGGEDGLASAGPALGMSKLINGSMTRADYLRRYGHRSPTEFEISTPDANEDPGWLDDRIAEFRESGIDPADRMHAQNASYEDALRRFDAQFPNKAGWLRKSLSNLAAASQGRETFRSEWTRTFRVNRAFALKAAELTGTGENIFYLYIDEILALLAGNLAPLDHIKARKATVARYRDLPPLPSIIRGRFDPFAWASDPKRRNDVYDPSIHDEGIPGEYLKGYAGAAGRVEGIVRVLAGPEEAGSFKTGEILVTTTTNVGWTPLFPRAAAIVTDIGAPLSHAAIVARELGIPAVVGTGSATARLTTGDRVVVDGGKGTVRIISAASSREATGSQPTPPVS